MKKVSVIILNWNGEAMLRRFLPDVVANTEDAIADVIVADNGSDDGSLKYVRSSFPQVKIMEFDRNYGFAEGYNRALASVATPLSVLLNSDVAPAAGWLAPLVRYMDDNPHCAACQPKILSAVNPFVFEFAGAAGGFLDRNGYPYCRGRIFNYVEPDRGQYDSSMEVDWASGAALMVRTRLYAEAGGLDAAFFAHMEEIDLCWRLRLRGYTIAAVPASVVYHLGGGTLSAENPRKTYLNFRNNLLMLYKNLPAKGLRRRLVWRRLLDTAAWGMYVVTGKWKFAGAILKAHRDFRKMKKSYAAIERPVDNFLKPRPDILWKYYLLRKKRFSQL